MEHESIARVLWRKAKAGDASAFEELFELHVDWMLVFVRTRLGAELREKIEAEDILQDAFVGALKGFDEFDYTDDGGFRRWMCRIVDNRLRDHHDYFSAQKRQVAPVPRSAPTGPITAMGRAENREQIELALGKLSDEHREVLLLRYFEGLNCDETGQRMNRSAGAIRNLCTRALVELGKHLQTVGESQS
ncbi:MAG: RNA polymerase sigma factor [Planctomycetota bacterium]|nr:RNA polymerase sigma factor [Planctomycetota bacterium]